MKYPILKIDTVFLSTFICDSRWLSLNSIETTFITTFLNFHMFSSTYYFLLHRICRLSYNKWEIFFFFNTVNGVVITWTSCYTIHFIRSVSFYLSPPKVKLLRRSYQFEYLRLFGCHLSPTVYNPPFPLPLNNKLPMFQSSYDLSIQDLQTSWMLYIN